MAKMSSSTTRISVFVDEDEETIRLRIPKGLWNACEAQYRVTKPQCKPRAQVQHPVRVSKAPVARAKAGPKPTPLASRQCKARFFRFQYGGSKRQQRGGRQNEITYDSPCLKPTCANCWKWNPHLMACDDGVSQPKRCDSVLSCAPEDPDAPARSPLRSRQSATTLAFRSHEGRNKYAALIRVRETLEPRSPSLHSAGSDGGSVGSARSDGSSGRSRHRVRLVFRSRDGRGDFARLVQRYLQ